MAGKSKGEWKTKVLAEFKQSKSVVWRAQISTSPEGKQFAGIRKFIIKADGEEIPDGKNGISLMYDAGTLPEAVDGLTDLLSKLRGGKVKTKPDESEPDDKLWVIGNGEGLYVRGYKDGELKTTKKPEKMKRFSNRKEAFAWATKLTITKAGWEPIKLK